MSVPVDGYEAWLVERYVRDELRTVSAALMAADELADACEQDWSPATVRDIQLALVKYREATS
jgi:hypothetical protein